jgi:hypothetical protein
VKDILAHSAAIWSAVFTTCSMVCGLFYTCLGVVGTCAQAPRPNTRKTEQRTTNGTLQCIQQQHAPVDLLLRVHLSGDPAQVLPHQPHQLHGPQRAAARDVARRRRRRGAGGRDDAYSSQRGALSTIWGLYRPLAEAQYTSPAVNVYTLKHTLSQSNATYAHSPEEMSALLVTRARPLPTLPPGVRAGALVGLSRPSVFEPSRPVRFYNIKRK